MLMQSETLRKTDIALALPDTSPRGGCPSASEAGHKMPLSMVCVGERVRISSISGKDEIRHFLCTLGFVEDAEVIVVSEMDGNVIVTVKGTRLAISKVMASRILTVSH